MVVEIAPADAGSLPRIAQLTNKTNQFNVTTRRYSEADVTTMQLSGSDVFGMRVSDRFGDNGLVGVIILLPLADGAREIDTLLLSCRVMGRGVETALLGFVAAHARATGASRLKGRFIATTKNAPARDCFSRHDFSLVEQPEDGTDVWELGLTSDSLPTPAWLTVHAPELVG
jgi:FkbH-like protein